MSIPDVFAIVFGVFGIITGLAGMIVGILSYSHNKIDALNLFFDYDKDKEFLEGRKIVYNLSEKQLVTERSSRDVRNRVSCVVNAFQRWGLLVKHRQLPFWVFYCKKTGITASGIAVIRTYNKLKPTIKYFRNKNPKYAENYEWLYQKIVSCCPEYKNYR